MYYLKRSELNYANLGQKQRNYQLLTKKIEFMRHIHFKMLHC